MPAAFDDVPGSRDSSAREESAKDNTFLTNFEDYED